MANPVILVVDDDPQVLRAVGREVRGRFGGDYRIVASGSGADALDAIRRLTLRGTPIALLVVDQRMPGMSGVELLGATLTLLPATKRVLLTQSTATELARLVDEMFEQATRPNARVAMDAGELERLEVEGGGLALDTAVAYALGEADPFEPGARPGDR